MASLTFLSEPRVGERVLLEKKKTTFGRHQSCDCRLSGKTVSREHFSIEYNNGKFFLVDHGSVNGTRANDERVSWVELNPGDTIQAGPYVLVFEDDGEATNSDREEAPSGDSETDLKEQTFTDEHSRVYPPQYLAGIEHFNAGRFFDAHEVWEEIWLHASDQTKLFYQMLIQAAVGLHHYERANMRGASGMYQNVVAKLERLPAIYMSIDLVEFARELKRFFGELDKVESESEITTATKSRPVIVLLEGEMDTGEFQTQWE